MMMENILAKSDGESVYQKCKLKTSSPIYSKKLNFFGEICVVKDTGDKIKVKLKNRGTLVFVVGYPQDCAEGTFRILKLNTRRVVIRRDFFGWINYMEIFMIYLYMKGLF